MRILSITVALLFTLCSVGWANLIDDIGDFFSSKSEDVGLPVLKLGVGAKGLALGGGVLARDATLLFWNPSQIPLVSGLSAAFSHTSHFLDTRYEFAGVVWGNGGYGFGIGAEYFSSGEIELRDERQILYGTYTPFTLISYLSYAKKMEEILFGGSFKYIYEKSHVYSLRGVALDLGFNYAPINNLLLTFVASNIGPRVHYGIDNSNSIRLPLTFTLDVGYEIEKFGLCASFRKALDEVLTSSFGVEYTLNPYLTLRAGERFGYDSKSASFGIGINYENFALDYAYLPFELDLGSSHHITLVID